ncbi:MAG: hypothetical protein RLO48_17175 [Bauldia litoralis]
MTIAKTAAKYLAMVSAEKIRWRRMRVVVCLAIALVLAAYPAFFASTTHGAAQAFGMVEVTDAGSATSGHTGHIAGVRGDCQTAADSHSGMDGPFSLDNDGCCADSCAPSMAVLVTAAECSSLLPEQYATPTDPAALLGACLLPNRPPQ